MIQRKNNVLLYFQENGGAIHVDWPLKEKFTIVIKTFSYIEFDRSSAFFMLSSGESGWLQFCMSSEQTSIQSCFLTSFTYLTMGLQICPTKLKEQSHSPYMSLP